MMGGNQNEANITLNSSTDFVLQALNSESCNQSTTFSDFATCNIALHNPPFVVGGWEGFD
jgi:hypothetical protein